MSAASPTPCSPTCAAPSPTPAAAGRWTSCWGRSDMSARVINADVLEALPTLAPGSVDVVCTSPPYWALRSYLPNGHEAKAKELGSEATPDEYVARMVEVFRLVRRVLAPHGTCWVNIGDTFANDPSGFAGTESAFGKGSNHDGAKGLGLRKRNLAL